MLKPKVSIIGAGNVGMRYAYSLLIAGLARSVSIVDIDERRAEGERLDLASGMPYLYPVEVNVGGYETVAESDLVVITAGKKQQPGQSRLALLKDNVEIFKEMVPQLMRVAPGALFLVVTNPVDVLSYVACKVSGKPSREVIGSGTVLDSARLRLLLSQHCKIDARNIHAYILGEHGDSEFAAWSAAMIGGVPLLEYCHACNKCDAQINFKRIFEDVKNFAYEIIARKGETSYGIGLALTRITEAVIKNENSILPVSCYIEDYYDIGGIYMSIPAVVNAKGIREVLRLRLADEEVARLRESALAIRTAIKSVGV